MVHATHRYKNFLSSYLFKKTGAIAPLFGILAPVLLASVGGAIDVSYSYLIKQRLSHALDAAVLAAAASETERTNINNKVNRFLDMNYPQDKIGTVFDVDINVNGDIVNAKASAAYNTYFAKFVGINEIDVSVETEVTREVRGIEVALALDVTGSMQSNNNIGALRDSTRDFITTIFDRVSDAKYLKIGMVPYAATVNVGPLASEVVYDINIPDRPDVTYDTSDPTQWQGCIEERDYPDDVLDTNYFKGGHWKPFWWEHTADHDDNFWDQDMDEDASLNLPYNRCNNRRTPNLGCPVDNPIMPLTSNEQDLLNSTDDLVYWCRGGTMGNIGLAWSWRVLSPSEPFKQGAEYENAYWRKVIVMMTDGNNSYWKKPGIDESSDYTAYGRVSENRLGTTNRGAATNKIDARLAETCEEIKKKGVTIYTVTFTNVSGSTEDLYRDCASDSTKYYNAPSQQNLRDAFLKISKEISNLHVSY